MQHDDCKDYAETNPVRRLNNPENVNITCDEVSSRSSKSENAELFIINDTPVSNNFRKGSSSYASRVCHADSSMAQPASSNSFYNPQTGTSIVHISSNSLVSSTLRENSNYIDRQWAILKEKMLPATKGKPSSSDKNKDIAVPDHVEERYEVDFSFIDDPNGNELDNNFPDSCKSNNMTCHLTTVLHGDGSINDNSNGCEPTFSDNHKLDGSAPTSISMQALTEDKPPNKSSSDNATSSDLKRFTMLDDMPKHSFNEKSKNDCNMVNSVICDINRSLVTSKPSLLVPSYKDEFLYNANPLYLKKNKEPIHEYPEHARSTYRDARTPKCPDVNKMPVVSSYEGIPSSAMNVGYSCPSEAAKDHEAQKSSEESKSKKYQEMHSRKEKKKQKKLEQNTTSNLVPDYKGNIPLEEIINFINKDVKVSSLAKSAKNSKKHKKKISKKDSLDDDLSKNLIQQKTIEPLNDDFQNVIESSYGKKSMELNNLRDFESPEIKLSKDCSEECDPILQSTGLEKEPEHVSTSKDSFGDCDQFSVVKKKKKLKKTVCSNGMKKSVSEDSFLPGIVTFRGKSSFEECSKSKKNEANMCVKGNIHVGEQNIPKSKNRPSIQNHVEGKEASLLAEKLINFERRKMSQNLAELPKQVTPKLSELSNCKHIHEKDEGLATTIAWNIIQDYGRQGIIPCLSISGKSQLLPTECSSKSLVAMDLKVDKEPAKPKAFVTASARKPESLSKTKSAFDLKHAQAFMNSTYQEVIKNKGYILYNQSN